MEERRPCPDLGLRRLQTAADDDDDESPCCPENRSGGGRGGGRKIVVSNYGGLVFVVATCSFCIPMFVAGIVLTSASLNSATAAMYRTGVSLLAVSVFMALVSIALIVFVCTGVCGKRGQVQQQHRTAETTARRTPTGQQSPSAPQSSRDPVSRQLSTRPSLRDLIPCQPPPYICSYSSSSSVVEPFCQHETLSAPILDPLQQLRGPSRAWVAAIDATSEAATAGGPQLHLPPPYALHRVPMEPYPAARGRILVPRTVAAWEISDKDDRPPTYEESCHETGVIHM